MDQPGLDAARHDRALRGLARINAWSGAARLLWPAISWLSRELSRPLRLLDIATGAGDVPLRLWRRAARRGLRLEIEGCDKSATALDHARRRADKAGAPIRFFAHDVCSEPLPGGFDIVSCSLFLHHLDENEATALLRRMKEAAGRLVLVSDLRRSALGWLMAWLGCRLLTRSEVVRYDGPASVRAAFTVAEARDLAWRAGLTGATVGRRWPWRWLLTWDRRA